MSIEAHILTWSTLNWKSVWTQADLLTIQTEQLLCWDIDLEETAVHIKQIRQQDKNWINSAQNVKNQSYKIKNLVLLYNSQYKKDNTADWKLNYWWLGLYKIVKTNSKKRNYVLTELDETQKSETVLKLRLKSYLERHEGAAQDYKQWVDTQQHSNSSDSDLKDHTEHNMPTSLTDWCTQKSAEDADYSDSDKAWCFSQRTWYFKQRGKSTHSLQKLHKTLTFQWIDNASILLLPFLLLKQWISVNFLITLSSALFPFFSLFFSLQYHMTEWWWQHNQLSSSILFLLVLLLALNSQHYLMTKSQALHFSFYVSHLINTYLHSTN